MFKGQMINTTMLDKTFYLSCLRDTIDDMYKF